ncbi:MAG: ComF family protein [Clostridia bacterium]|nr:ComF family protein [Clostridia bacterium]
MKIKRIFFPSRCGGCGKLIKVNETVCRQCGDSLMRIAQPACRHCGMSEDDCNCDTQAFYFENYAAAFIYQGAAVEMLRSMKFHGKKENAVWLARLLAQTAARAFPDAEFDLVIGIPMTKRDIKQRGFNQSDIMAKHTARFLHTAYSSSALFKTRETEKQHMLNSQQRKINLAGAFSADKNAVEGKIILLCDDIRTTGSTLYYATDALISAGARAVYCVTAALV